MRYFVGEKKLGRTDLVGLRSGRLGLFPHPRPETQSAKQKKGQKGENRRGNEKLEQGKSCLGFFTQSRVRAHSLSLIAPRFGKSLSVERLTDRCPPSPRHETVATIWAGLVCQAVRSAAVPYAAILEHKVELSGGRIGVILTGGNVDLDALPWKV